MRLVNGAGDDLDGLLIDRYNKHLHVQVLTDHWHQQMDGDLPFLDICHAGGLSDCQIPSRP